MQPIKVLIEIPAGSSIKYEIDKKNHILMVDRFLHTAMFYPFNYGYVPNTLADDGDATDVLVLSSMPVAPGAGIKAQVIGMLEMEDEAGIDTKLIAVPTVKIDPVYGAWKDIDDVPEHYKNMIKHFFEHYKDLEPGKWVKAKKFLGRTEAEAEIKQDMERKNNQ
ncbi:MAG: inorganic diphosphatase [Candidatus Zixiibacteriota bacterium]|nr:MAG: inorganic diphosphatase [candidate division Zixibacteria bacterium]